MNAIYTYSNYNYCIRIPKKRGAGYLKSCIGWHYSNGAGRKLDDLLPSFFDAQVELADIDGYLDIPIKTDCTLKDSKMKALKLNDVLKIVFPHVTGFDYMGWNKFFTDLSKDL